MANLQLRLPETVHRTARRIAKTDHISLNQFIVASVSNELVRHETSSFFNLASECFDEKAFIQVLRKVPNIEPDERDKI